MNHTSKKKGYSTGFKIFVALAVVFAFAVGGGMEIKALLFVFVLYKIFYLAIGAACSGK